MHGLQLSLPLSPPHTIRQFPISRLSDERIKIYFFQEAKILSWCNLSSIEPRTETTAGRKTQNADLRSSLFLPFISLTYCRAVLRWSFARVATSRTTSFKPGASGPWRNTFSWTRLCLAQISNGRANSPTFNRNGIPRSVVTIPTQRPRWDDIWSNSRDVRPNDSRMR